MLFNAISSERNVTLRQCSSGYASHYWILLIYNKNDLIKCIQARILFVVFFSNVTFFTWA